MPIGETWEFLHWEFLHVAENGDIIEEGRVTGNVRTEPHVAMSKGEGCGNPGCHCSDGYWVSISAGRDEGGTVRGITLWFDDAEQADLAFCALQRRCRVCGCSALGCQPCIERTGEPCRWVEDPQGQDLCSACAERGAPGVPRGVEA